MKHISYCCTCLLSILILFIFVYLGKTQMSTLEPMVGIGPSYPSTDVLLDYPTKLQIRPTTYKQLQKYRQQSPVGSFEQTTNNQKYNHPDNGTMELPELSGFY